MVEVGCKVLDDFIWLLIEGIFFEDGVSVILVNVGMENVFVLLGGYVVVIGEFFYVILGLDEFVVVLVYEFGYVEYCYFMVVFIWYMGMLFIV